MRKIVKLLKRDVKEMNENAPKPTVVQFYVPFLLHGLFKAAVEDLIEGADPLLHLRFAVCSQQERALVLHLQLKGKPAHFAVLEERFHTVHFSSLY